MPRFPAFFIVLVLALVIAACEIDDDDNDITPDAPAEPTPVEDVNDDVTGDEEPTPTLEPEETPVDDDEPEPIEPGEPEVTTFVEGVNMPGALTFTNDGRMFFNETWDGRIRVVENGQLLDEPFAEIDIVQAPGFTEHGLLGLALHPDFDQNGWVYAFYTVPDDQGGPSHQRIVRFTEEDNVGTNEEVIIDNLPVGPNCCHNGGRLKFGPDGLLYVTLGDVEDANRSQDPADIAGSILRYTDEGEIPEDNPFGPDNPVYTYGLRNPYGLTFHPETNELWITENGPDGFDEVNLIRPGENYGWPEARGMAGDPDYVDPIWATGQSQAIGPTGIQIPTGDALPELAGRVIFCDWNTATARVLEISDDYEVMSEGELPVNCNLDVTEGTDGALYLSSTEAIFRYGPPVE
jgi:aldose sugar dehydrogenase